LVPAPTQIELNQTCRSGNYKGFAGNTNLGKSGEDAQAYRANSFGAERRVIDRCASSMDELLSQ